jgi:hypothetical protein
MFQGHYARFIRFWIRIATTDRRAIAFPFILGLTQLDDFSRAQPARNRLKSGEFIASA